MPDRQTDRQTEAKLADSRRRIDAILAESQRNWEALRQADAEAKAKGALLNRYIDHPFADGRAFYRIVRVYKRTVRIQVVTGIGDDWVLPAWGERTSIPLAVAERMVYSRDRLDALFARKDKEDA